jgi:hypothetical protein
MDIPWTDLKHEVCPNQIIEKHEDDCILDSRTDLLQKKVYSEKIFSRKKIKNIFFSLREHTNREGVSRNEFSCPIYHINTGFFWWTHLKNRCAIRCVPNWKTER